MKQIFCTIANLIRISNFVLQIFYGGLAHLARAFDWQSKGGRFDPDILHFFILLTSNIRGYFVFKLLLIPATFPNFYS